MEQEKRLNNLAEKGLTDWLDVIKESALLHN